MSAETIDPLEFKSWEDAFNYPLPNIRQFENRLRNHAEDGRQKLRGMVGASYRKLLETADEITDMKDQSENAETLLGHVGLLCSSRAVERLQAQADVQARRAGQATNFQSQQAAELSLLDSCAVVLHDLLNQKGSLLLAAKILVLARLTMSTTTRRHTSMPFLSTLRTKLSVSRKNLLARLDRRLSNVKITPQALIDDLCAYALAANAAPKDTLRHLLKTRLEAIRDSLQASLPSQKCIVRALRLLIRTIQDLPATFTRYLPQGLNKLRAEPILKQEDVRKIHRLRLGVVERWLPEELHNYRPWFRQEDLPRESIASHAKTWAEKAVELLLSELPMTLERVTDLGEILQTRRYVLETWSRLSRQSLPLDCKAIQVGLRAAFKQHSTQTIRNTISRLGDLSMTLKTFMTKDSLDGSPHEQNSLWYTSTSTLSATTTNVKEAAISGVHGAKGTERQILEEYASWQESASRTIASIKSMQAEKWAEDFFDSSDEDDAGSEGSIDFNLEDGKALLKITDEAVDEASGLFRQSLGALIDDISTTDTKLIRTVISMTRIVSGLGESPSSTNDHHLDRRPLVLSVELIKPLWSILVDHVLKQINLVKAPAKLSHEISKSTKATSLWEGTPPLPGQPSPLILRFLLALTSNMSACGLDIWGPGLQSAVKSRAAAVVVEAVNFWLKTGAVSSVNNESHTAAVNREAKGDEKDAEAELLEANRPSMNAKLRIQAIQLLFDLILLGQALGVDSFANQVEAIVERFEIEDSSKGRLERGARDHWRKTYLLFALLQ